MNIKKQLIDQTGHFLIGLALALILCKFVVPFLAIGIILMAAFAREIHQHDSLKLGFGSLLDMSFWLFGSIAGVYIAGILYG